MAQNQQSVQLFPVRGSFSDVMVRGNILLSTGRSAEAIRKYTKVLYKLSPAHVCAFLNRSLAFLEEGYYELAVMDAHRAKVAIDELRGTSQVLDRRGSHIVRYLRAERLHVDAHNGWTQAAQRNVGQGWARSPLASIAINCTPNASVQPFSTSKNSLIRALQIRATYRLCGALFMVGQGARKDALDLIENMRLTMEDDSWESRAFNKLGNDILDQVVSEVDPIDPMAIRLLGDDTREKREERMKKLTENMKLTTTRYGYGDYSWNSYEPNLGATSWQMRLQAWVESCNDNCSAAIVHPTGTKPYAELRANQDIKSGDLVLSERTFASVTTSEPEKVRKNRLEGILDHFYCTTCATLLAVPLRVVKQHDAAQKAAKQHEEAQKAAKSEIPAVVPTPPSSTIPPQGSNTTTEGNPNTGTNPTSSSRQPSSRPLAPPSLTPPPPPRPDFEINSPHRLVPTCSRTCRDSSNAFDAGIHGTNLARQLREDHLHYLQPRPMTDRKSLCLRDLIFLRAIILAINFNAHPLDISTLTYATSGPNNPNTHITEIDPWSYTSHVVRPVDYLQKLLINAPTDQWLRLNQFDGWILHALLAKISKAMRVFKSPRFAKFYDEDSDLVAALGDEHPRWDLLTRIPKKLIKEDKNDEPVWSAGVDPLLNLIRIADLNKGEEPNVEVVQREGLFVIALGNQGGGEVAIKAGESLLRAGDGGEGRVGAGKGDGFEGRVGVGKGDGGEGRVGVGAGMGDEGEEKPELEKTDEEEAWYVAWLDEMMHDRAGEEEDVVLSFFTCG